MRADDDLAPPVATEPPLACAPPCSPPGSAPVNASDAPTLPSGRFVASSSPSSDASSSSLDASSRWAAPGAAAGAAAAAAASPTAGASPAVAAAPSAATAPAPGASDSACQKARNASATADEARIHSSRGGLLATPGTSATLTAQKSPS